jgi:hypothetical protein
MCCRRQGGSNGRSSHGRRRRSSVGVGPRCTSSLVGQSRSCLHCTPSALDAGGRPDGTILLVGRRRSFVAFCGKPVGRPLRGGGAVAMVNTSFVSCGDPKRGRKGLQAAPRATLSTATCHTCFFGVEHLCCLRVAEPACPTYRFCDGPGADCLRRPPRRPEQMSAGASRTYARLTR